MCTVSYIPTKEGFILTSNRDELHYRPTIPPKEYLINEHKVFFPKDDIAGGTWIAASQHNRLACLLNGAYEKHERKTPYAKSRGQILLDNFKHESIDAFISKIDLQGIEPFTLLLIENNFVEFRWDAEKKHVKEIDRSLPSLWQSATLYDKPSREKRNKWFVKWTEKYRDEEDKNILQFHQSKHSNDKENDILMERSNGLKTVSITQIKHNNKTINFTYFDLNNNTNTTIINQTK